jgi:hypothetical protein
VRDETSRKVAFLHFLAIVCLIAALGCDSSRSKPRLQSPASNVVGPTPTEHERIERYSKLVLTAPVISEQIDGQLRAINQPLLDGCSPSDNCSVLLVQALGTGFLDQGIRDLYLRMLGIEKLSEDRSQFQSAEDFIIAVAGMGERDARMEALEEQLASYQGFPISPGQYPDLEAYMVFNRDPLQTIADAAHKPCIAFPLVSLKPPPRIITLDLPLENQFHLITRTLKSRAMLSAGRGEIDAALTDLNLIRRLARHSEHGPSFVHHLVGYGMEYHACQGELNCLATGLINGETARRHLADLRAVPPIPFVGEFFRAERQSLDEGLAAIKSGAWSNLDFSQPAPDSSQKHLKEILQNPKIQWDVVRAAAHEQLDRAEKAVADPYWTRRRELSRELVKTMDDWKTSSPLRLATLPLTLALATEKESQFLGRSIAFLAMPAFERARLSYDRNCERQFMMEVGLSLVAYRDENGAFPERVTDLVSKFFPSEPLDPATNLPLTYSRSSSQHCRVYCWGANGIDDGGRPLTQEMTDDDLTIELNFDSEPDRSSSPP